MQIICITEKSYKTSQHIKITTQPNFITIQLGMANMAFLQKTFISSPKVTLCYRQCFAKTFTSIDGDTLLGHTVLDHCQIVGKVAKALARSFPISLQDTLFPAGFELLAACHDIGKVSPTFHQKLHKACPLILPELKHINPEIEKQWGYHAGTGQIACKAMNTPPYVAEIVGQHHGFSPQADRDADHESLGGKPWQHERERLVEALKEAFETDWPEIRNDAQARMLAGLTSVSDWIGSGELFENPEQDWRPLIDEAIAQAGFRPLTCTPDLSFEQVFGFSTRPAQQTLIDQVQGPGVYILEAPMGLGKTEAALYAAYRVLSRQQACGIYFALPTQLTSNKLYERFQRFLERTLAPNDPHRPLLLHSQAQLQWLKDTAMGEDAAAGGSWFHHSKRGLLAPLAVGTLDQALMSVINVKHGFVRAFGLAGKVVILDEVHSYDTYTGTLLNALVRLLRELHCTVIILTATLDRQRRQALLGDEAECQRNDYPLITASNSNGLQEVALPFTETPIDQTVDRRFLHDEKLAIDEALRRADSGQQVLWIENTVDEAQNRYLDLAARAHESGVACGLLHSRFTAGDRQRLETQWVNLFGKEGWSKRHEQGRILIGTQVLEQSLDIDADFLISRFCPTDMLLQRMGRLWRHLDDPRTNTHGTPRVAGARCEAWILAPELERAIEQPDTHFGASALVYSPYVLCRSLECWHTLERVSLPGDIRALIEATYRERSESGAWQRMWDLLIEGRNHRIGRRQLEQMARSALAPKSQTLSEHKARTRFSEIESCETFLFKQISLMVNGMTQVTLLNGETLEWPQAKHQFSQKQWRQLGSRLMQQTVKVPAHRAPLPLDRKGLEKMGFHHCLYLGDPAANEALPRFALSDEEGCLRSLNGSTLHERYRLEYRSDLGYRALKD